MYVRLYLFAIPPSGYISPAAMVACVSVMGQPRIDFALIKEDDVRFRFHRSALSSPLSPHSTFRGLNEYLEDLVARIDVLRLNELRLTIDPQPVSETRKRPDKGPCFIWTL